MKKGQLPVEARQQFKAAQEAIKRRDIDAARSLLLGIELGSSFMLFHRMMAACAYIDKDYDLASSHIEQAIALMPGKQVLLADAIRIYISKNDQVRCSQLFQSFNISQSDSSQELLRVALAMKSLGHFKDAATVLEKALRLSPENVRIRIHYGVLLALQDLIDDAMRQWSFALKYNPSSIQAMVCLGRLYVHLNDHIKAIDYFRSSLDISTGPADGRKLDLAEAYVRASSVNEAREMLASLDALESHPRLHYLWGLLHLHTGEVFLAYSSFNRCVELGREKNNNALVQLSWPSHPPSEDLMRQAINDARPTLDAIFDPLALLKLTEHELDSSVDDIFQTTSEAF